MSQRQKDLLCIPTTLERLGLDRLSRAQAEPAAQVVRDQGRPGVGIERIFSGRRAME
jgi:hypothetical protein